VHNSTKAILILIGVTAIWGLTFPLIYAAVEHIDPDMFVLLRFALASIVLLPWIKKSFRLTTRSILIGGLILGLLNAGTYLFQTIGLQTVTPSRTAFITSIYVVLVPLLSPLFRLSKIKFIDIFSALLCLTGLYVLTGGNIHHISSGDLWVLLCALTTAVQIIVLQILTIKIRQYLLLAFFQIFFTLPVTFVIAIGKPLLGLTDPSVIIALLFCGVMATSLALFLQTKYQHYTSANEAALIYCLEPLFAVLFAWIIDGEKITAEIIFGGGIILTAMMLPLVSNFIKRQSSS